MFKKIEGKSKILSPIGDDKFSVVFKDWLESHSKERKEKIIGTGKYRALCFNKFFEIFEHNNIKTHLISFDKNELVAVIKKVDMIKIEFIMRYRISKDSSFNRELTETYDNVAKLVGKKLEKPLFRMTTKSLKGKDFTISAEDASALSIFKNTKGFDENMEMYLKTRVFVEKISKILHDFLESKGLYLVDFKLEIGFNDNGDLILADEISPDGMRIWTTSEWINGVTKSLDKDTFRNGEDPVVAYKELWNTIS